MGGHVEGSIYYYAPNKIAPIFFIIFFFSSGILHFYQTARYRSWRTTALMPWASLLLTVGFALREVGAFNYIYSHRNLDIYIAEYVMIMSGPPVYAAINYIVLSRILFYVPYLSPIHPGRVLTTFLAADTVCEILIINGVQRIVNSRASEASRKLGGDLTKAGLILQAILFLLFVLLAAVFQRRAQKAHVLTPPLKTTLTVLYISCIIVTTRCIYRIVEFFEWGNGPLTHSEVYFWIFEASIMFINTAMLNIWHPGKRLPRSNHIFLAKDGKTELLGPGWEDKRPFLLTFFDPFDIVGLVTGKDKKTKLWDMSPEELKGLDEARQRKKAEKLAKPRSAFEKALDPAHLFGHGGWFVKMAKRLEKEEVGHVHAMQGSTERKKPGYSEKVV
ncbi:Serine/threonine-protein phosphatase T [Venturia nashicola]|nr:Serine/threonine-protein phosphatase T [Venturia nashicola]